MTDATTTSLPDPVDALRAREREVSAASARLLSAVVDVAADAKPGFEADEVAFALAWTQVAARTQVEFGRYLIGTLPDVFAALAIGVIDVRRAWVFFDALAAVDDEIAAEIAAAVLPKAPGLTTTQLRDRLRRAVLKVDPDVARRVTKSIRRRHVACTPDGEGTATLFGVRLPAVRAVAAYERVDAFARGRKHAGDARTLDQLRADTFLDLLEGIGITAAPVDRAGVIELTVAWSTATGATNEPAVLTGFGPIAAQTARDIIAARLPRVVTGTVTAERDSAAVQRTGPDAIRWRHTLTSDRGALLDRTRLRRAPDGRRPDASNAAHRHDRGADASASRTALHDGAPTAAASRAAAGPPRPRPPSEDDPSRRTPNAALAQWIATRDRTCRAPGCRVPARVADIDHTVDHSAGGTTTHDNLAVLCRHHHRLKHEGGWFVSQPAPGTLTWTSPAGRTYVREPDPPD
ncbi:MAG TPA: DUF222 domain-containing protein [Micromonosporaceae bacterium]|nr:DUF222 domain-containing protein [Micromonosporaceae bacterium]